MRARLVVAADGRNSGLARLAGVETKTINSCRFTYFTYYSHLPLPSRNDSQLWLLDPDVAYALPNEDQITLLALWLTKDKLPAFKQDRHAAFDAYLRMISCELDFDRAERISDVMGAIDLVNSAPRRGLVWPSSVMQRLPPIRSGALGADGRAFQSAEWLVDRTPQRC